MSAHGSPLVSEEYQEQLIQKGQTIYNAKLKDLLEISHNNEYIVIHVDTEDYALGRTFREASQALQSRHLRDGRIVGWKIGLEPDNDALARMVAAEILTGHTK